MEVRFVEKATGEELLLEHAWTEDLPRAGDVIQLGGGRKWTVKEVDWVFEGDGEKREDVPLRQAVVYLEVYTGGAAGPATTGKVLCECGHPEDMHTPIRCAGKGNTCECPGFRPAQG
ncbi:MAG: hypothetical protein KatS3mg015_0059 [Fimbriimonadales bacterium]|nr:MAG: hypothetical protein KatS3mg015_0059 [Fimbriimonadales bacterium]